MSSRNRDIRSSGSVGVCTGKSLTTASSFEERSFEKLTNFSGVKFSRAKNGANDPLSGNFTSDT